MFIYIYIYIILVPKLNYAIQNNSNYGFLSPRREFRNNEKLLNHGNPKNKQNGTKIRLWSIWSLISFLPWKLASWALLKHFCYYYVKKQIKPLQIGFPCYGENYDSSWDIAKIYFTWYKILLTVIKKLRNPLISFTLSYKKQKSPRK